MHEYYFADYRLLVDDAISKSDEMKYLARFSKAMPATHTFTLRLGDEAMLDQKYAAATIYPAVFDGTARRPRHARILGFRPADGRAYDKASWQVRADLRQRL